MPHIEVVSFARLEADAADAYARSISAAAVTSDALFKRTATELAGDDGTLQRVLLARLRDAYNLGQRDERVALHAEFDARYRL